MRGQMMDYPLTLTHVLDRARQLYGKKEIVTKAGPTLERYTYAEMAERVGAAGQRAGETRRAARRSRGDLCVEQCAAPGVVLSPCRAWARCCIR